ncbi:hypothetical protein PV377_44525 [Streptomyces ipomoeae]|uniref:hypothetical protein n=1 Tax=Streptomyces ipomoeae TaxID=103232 RepID=UPI0029A6D44F|nr:hypothetical protein [Streptomyces ipomoeae]MDX2845907.1 hypothetical protein [Streptomyces ipomoeae]
MTLLYLLAGILVSTSYNILPMDALADMQADPTRQPSHGELAGAVAVWVVAVAVWPLMVAFRALAAVRDRPDTRRAEQRDERTRLAIPGQRQPAEPAKAPVPAPRRPE